MRYVPPPRNIDQEILDALELAQINGYLRLTNHPAAILAEQQEIELPQEKEPYKNGNTKRSHLLIRSTNQTQLQPPIQTSGV